MPSLQTKAKKISCVFFCDSIYIYTVLYTYIHVKHTVLIQGMEQGSQVTRGRYIVGKLVQRHRVRGTAVMFA